MPAKPALQTHHSHPIAYRADIDGLRALAVTAVVLFHAYPKTFSSGFIGVDVFFVISGFLISSILFKENAKGSFTYADFYSRRIRRIYPTLLVVLVTTWWLGCLYLLAPKLKAMASTMLAGTVFGANIQVMLLERGYFDDDIKTNPLLHLWSLGVEEQFYIFWPCFVSIVSRLSMRTAIVTQVVVLALSFGCNMFLLNISDSNKYAFYFPFGRFWQMGVGGLLAYYQHFSAMIVQYSHVPTRDVYNSHSAGISLSKKQHEWSVFLSWSGLALICTGFYCLDEASAFPGFWALLPTVGAALLIFAGPEAWFNRVVLAHTSAVFIGKISYAFYLWHWPLLVFAKLRYPNPAFRPIYMSPVAMLVLAFGLSLSSVFHVENVLRRKKAKWVVPVLAGAMVGMTVLASSVVMYPNTFSFTQQALDLRSQLSAVMIETNRTIIVVEVPNSSRFPDFKNVTESSLGYAKQDWAPNEGLLPIPKDHVVGSTDEGRLLNPGQEARSLVVALGDSHLDMLKPRFFKLAQDTKPREFPTIAFKSSIYPALTRCVWWNVFQVNMIKTVGPKVVLYAINWLKILHPGGAPDDPLHDPKDVEDILTGFSVELSRWFAEGIRVFVTTVHPEGDAFDPKTMSSVIKPQPVNRTAFREHNQWLIGLVEHAITAANATILDLSDNYCWEDRCNVVDHDGTPIMKDSNTFTSAFAAEYLSVVDQVVAVALNAADLNNDDATDEAPNTSRYPRIEEPTVSKINQAVDDWATNYRVDELPVGFDAWGATQVMNPGQTNVIFAWGDSHTNMIKPRFFKGLMSHHVASNLSNFPTIYFRAINGEGMLPCNENYTAMVNTVKAVRPKVLLHSVNWPQYLRPKGKDSDEFPMPPKCCPVGYKEDCLSMRPKDVVAFLAQFQKDMAEFTRSGIRVFIATINPEGDQFDPKHMLSGDEVGDVRPVLKSAYREVHKELVGLVEAAIHGANATLLDYSDNYCWEDVCQVVDMYGNPIMKDNNHLRSNYAFKYLSVIDQVVAAAMS
ncbi:Aste57867_17271 [Aphanomyces stellatus]|uniref:Aste57867_17271 protein n=1 Tax=Aphanomyces stellatus TaxID=120398 RepID=A0A485L866_9STRA|nr:hypothetical protein As57867_017212 [Aphanomyces stellatus]VFT94027.1 Aste57867_17271 [Aphanomyces stellatus]